MSSVPFFPRKLSPRNIEGTKKRINLFDVFPGFMNRERIRKEKEIICLWKLVTASFIPSSSKS